MEKDLLSLIKKAGIVGAGGAGFPTHAKLNAKAEYVIINGAECEPLLRVDQQLMALHTKEILDALSLVVEHVGAKHGVVALKSKYKEAIKIIINLHSNDQYTTIQKNILLGSSYIPHWLVLLFVIKYI